MEEVRVEGEEMVGESPEYKQRSGFTHIHTLYFSILQEVTAVCVFADVCADELWKSGM